MPRKSSTSKPKATAQKKAPAKRSRITNAERAQIINSLAGRMRMVRRMAGVQYGGKRDVFQTAGYVPQGLETFADYWGVYDRGDIGGRIVDMPAKTTWRTPPEVFDDASAGEETEFEKAFAAMAKRLRLWHYFGRVDRLAGVGQYAVLHFGVQGSDDATLRQPLDSARPDQIIYLSVYTEDNAPVMEWDIDPGSPRFGLPELYQLRTLNMAGTGQSAAKSSSLIVHHSRVIHVAEDLLEDDVFGRPRLKRALNRLFDLEKVASSTGESYWQLVSRILQAKINPEAEIDSEDIKALDDQLEEMVHDLRRQFTGQGIELQWLQGQTPNVSQVADFYFSLIAGASGIPKRILFGSELGELASSQDQANFNGLVNERQEQFAEPMILRAFIDRMVALRALPQPKEGKYDVSWPTLFEESDGEKADANLKRAQTAAALTPVGGDPLLLVEVSAEGVVTMIERKAGTPSPQPELPPEPTLTDGGLPNDANPSDSLPPSADPNAAG